jgi:molybdopterin-containing oxidoreductase family iron-sulfur binding subunit
VSFSLKEDETALVSTIAAAVPHYLESWNDVSITKELTELHNQRFVLFFTKQFQDVLLSLTGLTGTFYDYIKANAGTLITGSTWNQVLHDGIYVGVASAASASSADYSVLQMLCKSKSSIRTGACFVYQDRYG